ncbi:hypothetical protein [Archangium sp.]|uniref:hypothetical protein n=1 Tax=Archangium sp. TaxID=1872627 RepID=UPI00286AA290|nr:hypothetical protein [Archangium sp.]
MSIFNRLGPRLLPPPPPKPKPVAPKAKPVKPPPAKAPLAPTARGLPTADGFSAAPSRPAPVNLSGASVASAMANAARGLLAQNVTGPQAFSYDRALPGAVSRLSGFSYAPEGAGSLAADAIARNALTGRTATGTDGQLNCVEGAVEAQDYFAEQTPPVKTELVVAGDHAVLRMPDGRYFDPTQVMDGKVGADPFLSSQEAEQFRGVDGITVEERRTMENGARQAAAELPPGATQAQREQAAIGAVRSLASEGALDEASALQRANNDGTVASTTPTAPETVERAQQDALHVEQVYTEQGPEAAADELERLATENKDVPGYTDVLVGASAGTINNISAELGRRITENDDGATKNILSSLSTVAELAGPDMRTGLGNIVASHLPASGELNQFDDAFSDLKGDGKGGALGNAIIESLRGRGNTAAADALAEDVAAPAAGEPSTETGTERSGSATLAESEMEPDHQLEVTNQEPATAGTEGTEAPREAAPAEEGTELASVEGEAEAEASAGLEASGSTEVNGVAVEGEISGPQVRVGATGSASVSTTGVDVEVKVAVDATLAQAGASGTVTVPVELPGGETLEVTVQIGAEGEVGATGELNIKVHLGLDGQPQVSVSGEGFAGAKGSITGGVVVSHEGKQLMSGELTASGMVGVAGSAEASFGLSDDGISFSAKAEVAVGAGWGIEVSGTVDPGATLQATQEIVQGLATAGLEAGATWTGNLAENAGEMVWDGAQVAGGAIWDGANWGAGKASDGAAAVWNGTKWVGREGSEVVWNGAKWVGGGFKDGVEKVWDGISGIL